MEYAKILLTEEQRLELTKNPDDIRDWKTAKYYTLNDFDIQVIHQQRKDYNRIGFALQLCCLRYPGWTLTNISDIPETVIYHVAGQIGADVNDMQFYGLREKTRLEHLRKLREIYGFRFFGDRDDALLRGYLMPLAMENDHILRLFKLSIERLREQKIILPGITRIENIVSAVSQAAEDKIYRIINSHLTFKQKRQLDELINATDETQTTPLAYLKENPGQSSPKAFMHTVERLEIIRKLNLNVDFKEIHPNRLKQLSRLGSRYEPYAFRRFREDKRYALLVSYLHELAQRLTDFAVEIHDRQINILLSKGRRQQEEIQKKNAKSLNEKIIHYIDIGTALIKSRNERLNPFDTIETVMSWSKVIESVEDAKKLTRPQNYDYLDLLSTKYHHLRKYTPSLVKHLKFTSTNSSMNSMIKALSIIHAVNEEGKRKIPDDAPVDFITKRWGKYIYEPDGSINRYYYEMAAYTELKNRIRSGDIAVEGSRNYRNFDEYLLPENEWKREIGKLAVNACYDNYMQERTKSMHERIQWLSENIHQLAGIDLSDGKIHIERLNKETPEEAEQLSERLYGILPHIKLTDLLLEVSGWTGFDRYFTHASTGSMVQMKEKPVVLAALMAMGTNIGLSKMADCTPCISYHQMANAVQWRMYDEAMKRVQSCLVNYQHKQSLPARWGDGTTSSSDGMRIQVGVSSLEAERNPHYGLNKGTTIYRFVSDQFSAFYTKVINTNARDAVHVIDGLLYHETELCIDEHYTDTAGYTDQVFALSHLLGFRFAPRIRDIDDAKLYMLSKTTGYENIAGILQGKINTNIIRDNYNDVLRLACSIRNGKVSGSLMMSKLGSYARQNSLATALREMGRIEKTIFILDYISNEALRRRIQRGLNKGEAMNALARNIFFGKRGEFRERELQDQLQRASALNILINAISVWNTVYLQKAIEYLKSRDELDEMLIKHISPLGWAHINFLGEYFFNLKNIPKNDELRPLNVK
jgi:TnpA family transposase